MVLSCRLPPRCFSHRWRYKTQATVLRNRLPLLSFPHHTESLKPRLVFPPHCRTRMVTGKGGDDAPRGQSEGAQKHLYLQIPQEAPFLVPLAPLPDFSRDAGCSQGSALGSGPSQHFPAPRPGAPSPSPRSESVPVTSFPGHHPLLSLPGPGHSPCLLCTQEPQAEVCCC